MQHAEWIDASEFGQDFIPFQLEPDFALDAYMSHNAHSGKFRSRWPFPPSGLGHSDVEDNAKIVILAIRFTVEQFKDSATRF